MIHPFDQVYGEAAIDNFFFDHPELVFQPKFWFFGLFVSRPSITFNEALAKGLITFAELEELHGNPVFRDRLRIRS